MPKLARVAATTVCLAVGGVGISPNSQAELTAEPIPSVLQLPAAYPDSLLFVHDTNFAALIAGRIVLVDVAATTRNYLGALDAAQFASFVESRRKGELYVTETFYSRGTRGKRTDLLTIHDKSSLAPIAELELPGGKRAQAVSHRYTLQLVDNDQFLLVYNFTPAASVTVIDIDQRAILNELPIPGCGLIYPSGRRGFSSLCSNGSLYTVQFDEQGELLSQHRLPPFFDVDEDPLFDKPVYSDGRAWFASFKGGLQAVDFSKQIPEIGDSWSLLSAADRKENWRPGGWQIATLSDRGLLHVLMHPQGFDGSHKSGGSEVWVFDLAGRQRLKRIRLREWGVSIEVTRGEEPYLVVANGEMQLDIYAAPSGNWLKTIGGVAATPFNLHARR